LIDLLKQLNLLLFEQGIEDEDDVEIDDIDESPILVLNLFNFN